MALSDKEVDLLITKLREKYKESTVEYKTRIFNLDAFEDRFQTALRKRMNLEAFIFTEIANFEKLKQKCEEEKNPKKSQENTFTIQVDRIIEENTARIKKYSEIEFHTFADLELSHFYGALTDFVQFYLSVLWIILTENKHKDKLRDLENQFSEFAVPRGSRHPKRIEDHILILERRDTKEIEIEKHKNAYLKESAFILHDVYDFMEELIMLRNKDWENPLKFDKLYIAGDAKKKILSLFSQMTPYGVILKIKEQVEEILKDFRLESFRRKGFSRSTVY